MEAWLKPFLWCLALFRLLPFALTWCVFAAGRDEACRAAGFKRPRLILFLGAVLTLALNAGAAVALNMLAFHTPHVGETILRLVSMEGNYSEIATHALVLLACTALGLVFGFILRLAFFRANRPVLSRRRKAVLLLMLTLAMAAAFTGRGVAYFSDRNLTIGEVHRKAAAETLDLAENQALLWQGKEVCAVRVHNDGQLVCAPEELWLSETEDELRAVSFQNVRIPAGGDVWLVMDAEHGLDLKRHGGSVVYLANAMGELIDRAEAPPEAGYVPAPVLSAKSGFYDAPFDLTVTAEEGLTVHYTLDCSLPTADSPVYTEPVRVYDRSPEENRFRSIRNVRRDYLNKSKIGTDPVEKAFVIRAVAADAEGNLSEAVTGSYFVESRQDPSGWVISLVADPDDLFGYRGIYSTGGTYDSWYEENYAAAMELPRTTENRKNSFWADEPEPNFRKRGREWERPAHMTLLEGGEIALDQGVGIRVQGASACEKVLKRLSVFSRKEYSGSRLFDGPLFNNVRAHSFYLRDGVLNAVSQFLTAGRVMVSPGHAVDVYLNGEFWYRTFLWEKLSATLIANTYGANEAFVVTVKNGEISSDDPEQVNSYRSIRKFAEKNDLSDPDNYERFCEMVDVQNFIDVLSCHVYLANLDYSENHNNFLWRVTEKEDDGVLDTRWRWGLYDLDLIWSYARNVENNWEINGFKTTRPDALKDVPDQRPIFAALRKNPDFCRRFVLTFMDLVNTTFRPERAIQVLDFIGNEDEKFRNFFFNRPAVAAEHLAEEFELTGTQETVTLRTADPAAGTILLNTITPDLSSGSWSGQYFTDYPITLTAQPADGRVFSHWLIDGLPAREETVTLPVEAGGITVEAVFE